MPTDTIKMVVQCPSCKTSFTIDSATLELPGLNQFHCSKCDQSFTLELAGTDPLESDHPAGESEGLADFSEPPATSYALNWKEPSDLDAESEVAERLEEDGFNSHQLSGSTDDDSLIMHDLEVIDDKKWTDRQTPADMPEYILGAGDLDKYTTSWDKADASEILDEPRTRTKTSTNIRSKTKTPPAPRERFDGPEPANVFKLIFPVILVATCLCVLAAFIFLYPRLATKTLGIRNASSYFRDLHVSSNSLKHIPLASGEMVHVITGQIENFSSKDITDVQLEGVLFDASGNMIAKQKSYIGAVADEAVISSLTLQTLRDLQAAKPQSAAVLNVGQKKSFLIAVFPNNDSTLVPAASFSVRIYAATPE